MKKVMLGGVALITLGFVGAAGAADMPVKAPPPVVVNTWTGFYAGVDFGGINGSHEGESFTQSTGTGAGGLTVYDPTTLNSTNHWGAMGGVYAGYNWAVTPSWVVGVEGDWSKTNLGTTNVNHVMTSGGVPVPAGCLPGVGTPAGTVVTSTCTGLTMSDNLSWIATVRGRLGYTWGSMLLYGTGGVAFMNQELSGQIIPCTTSAAACTGVAGAPGTNLGSRGASIATSLSSNNSGWVAGGGIEVMATANWLVRIEYLHYAFGTGTTHSVACSLCNTGAAPAGGFNGPGNFNWGSANYDAVRAGLAYKF
jgi:outer membrane immunogenic protein